MFFEHSCRYRIWQAAALPLLVESLPARTRARGLAAAALLQIAAHTTGVRGERSLASLIGDVWSTRAFALASVLANSALSARPLDGSRRATKRFVNRMVRVTM